jgi:NTE family protein
MEEIARRISTKRAFFSLLDFTWGHGGLIKGKRIEGFLRSFLGEKTFADALIDLRIIATDLNTIQEIVFTEGSLVDAVRASIAIPGVITPVRNNGQLLIDGGITSPVPIGVLERMGVSKIIAVDTIPHSELMHEYQRARAEKSQASPEKKSLYDTKRISSRWHLNNNIMDINMRAMHAMQSQIANAACATADVVIRPVILDSAWYEFYDPEKYIRKGEESANEVLPALKKLVGK